VTAAVDFPPEFEQLLEYIRDNRGFDFTGYKRPSLMRRVDARMRAVKVADYDEYRRYLERHPAEWVDLFNTILINVTSFFRDQIAWDYMREEIVPRIVEQRQAREPIRVWSTGCASGEEAYSLAMTFAGVLGEDSLRERVKIYATDIDEEALTVGRHAVYPEKALEPVPAELRATYFEPRNGSFAFRTDLRRSVIFGRHDLIQDPPISRIDLLVSRNTLMYFNAETQEQILSNFHFALREGGFLFLGKSEALVARTRLFGPVDLKKRVFAKVPGAVQRVRAPLDREEQMLAELGSETLIREAGFEAAPIAQLVVDQQGHLALANMQARVLFGLTLRDIGRPLQDLELSYRPVELRSRIEQAYSEQHTITLRDVEWTTGGEVRFIDVQIVPLASGTGRSVGVGITFSDVSRYRRLQEALEDSKHKLQTANEELQSTNEELETTNEELQSTNEELETTNEELQSTNEELETMNEELQSTNEELETINDELQQRTDELNETNAFLEAILSGLKAAVLVVDPELSIQRWNDAAAELWGLQADETVAADLLNLDIGLPVEQLRGPLQAVLDGGGRQELVLQAHNRRGRPIECLVSVMGLARNGEPRGAILMMEHTDPAQP